MSTSNAITKTDLENIINAIFPATTDDMTQAQIDAFVASLNTSGVHAADYVVEKGFRVNGSGWSYVKWASGKLECWYVGSSGSYTCGTQRGNMYAGGWLTYSYPVAFVGSYSVTASATLTTDAYVVLAQISQPIATSCKVRVVAGSSIAQNSYEMHVYAVGQWK